MDSMQSGSKVQVKGTDRSHTHVQEVGHEQVSGAFTIIPVANSLLRDSLSDCKNGARLIPRAISPFVNVHQVLFVGLRLQGVRKQDWGEAGLLDL